MAGRAASLRASSHRASGSGSTQRHAGEGQRVGDGGAGLRAHLISQYRAGTLTATAVCTFAWHAVAAGAKGVEDLAYDPYGAHQAEHLRSALGLRRDFYVAEVPMWDHVGEKRGIFDFPINLPHEQFASAFSANPQEFQTARYEAKILVCDPCPMRGVFLLFRRRGEDYSPERSSLIRISQP